MHDGVQEDVGCEEYNTLSRRGFVGSAAALMAASTLPAWLPKVVLAETAASRDIVVSVFLRGGADGLSMIYPFLDTNYYAGRPTIAIPRLTAPPPRAASRSTGSSASRRR